jgi:hypothetical protein
MSVVIAAPWSYWRFPSPAAYRHDSETIPPDAFRRYWTKVLRSTFEWVPPDVSTSLLGGATAICRARIGMCHMTCCKLRERARSGLATNR